MALKPDDPTQLPYWLGRGAAKAAEWFTRRAKSGVEVMNKLRQQYKGMPMSIAGKLLSSTVQAFRAMTEAKQTPGRVVSSRSDIPVNPNLYPEGRMGRRYRYRVLVHYVPNAGGKPIVRTHFVDSPLPLSADTVEDHGLRAAARLLGGSPGGKGPKSDIKDYTVFTEVVSVWRSH